MIGRGGRYPLVRHVTEDEIWPRPVSVSTTDENVCTSAIYLPAGKSDVLAAGWGSFAIDRRVSLQTEFALSGPDGPDSPGGRVMMLVFHDYAVTNDFVRPPLFRIPYSVFRIPYSRLWLVQASRGKESITVGPEAPLAALLKSPDTR